MLLNWWMDGWFNGILSMQVAAIYHAWGSLKFINKANGVYKRDYALRINVMEEMVGCAVFYVPAKIEIRSHIEILANDIKVY